MVEESEECFSSPHPFLSSYFSLCRLWIYGVVPHLDDTYLVLVCTLLLLDRVAQLSELIGCPCYGGLGKLSVST